MSLDLLKEFAYYEEDRRNEIPGQTTIKETTAGEEEFGDFEDAESDQNPTAPCAIIHAIPMQTSSIERVMDSAGFDERIDFANHSVLFDAEETIRSQKDHTGMSQIEQQDPKRGLIVSVAHVPAKQHPTNPAFDQIESESFANVSQAPISPFKSSVKSAITVASATDKSKPGYGVIKVADVGPPPSNIPPPSVLLPLVATIFQATFMNVKEIAALERTSSDPYKALDQSRIQRIRKALSDVRAGARIMAGRKLRWKRDSILSQSMKIGPATGKISGMKLAGVDKTESRREDQEAAEALEAWKQQVGPLRSTISKVNIHSSEGGLSVPEISETMPIRVVKASEGAVMAPKCCFLCGIKRDERIAKVDVDVEDSFGEWWREHWGHIDCVAFWSNHKASLRQRS